MVLKVEANIRVTWLSSSNSEHTPLRWYWREILLLFHVNVNWSKASKASVFLDSCKVHGTVLVPITLNLCPGTDFRLTWSHSDVWNLHFYPLYQFPYLYHCIRDHLISVIAILNLIIKSGKEEIMACRNANKLNQVLTTSAFSLLFRYSSKRCSQIII